MAVAGTRNGRADLVIVGGGIAGVSACRAAVDAGARVTLVSGEDRVPYKRTRISKHIAQGFSFDQFAMHPAQWYQDRGVEPAFGERIVTIDAEQQTAITDTGRTINWHRLLLAPGGRPRRVAGDIPSERAHVVHAASDVESLREFVAAHRRILVAGGGVLGVEVAEQLSQMGLSVTMGSSESMLMHRELNRRAADSLLDSCVSAGIRVVLDARVDRVSWAGDGIVVTGNGGRFSEHFDGVVSCIGISPVLDLARRSGIATGRGILVDRRLETSIPGIYAAGDAAEHPDGSVTNLWHAAEQQGRVAALASLGLAGVEELKPFRLKCEVFGRYFFSIGKDEFDSSAVETVEEEAGCYRALAFRDGALCGVVMYDDGERAKQYERAVREGWSLNRVRRELPLDSSLESRF